MLPTLQSHRRPQIQPTPTPFTLHTPTNTPFNKHRPQSTVTPPLIHARSLVNSPVPSTPQTQPYDPSTRHPVFFTERLRKSRGSGFGGQGGGDAGWNPAAYGYVLRGRGDSSPGGNGDEGESKLNQVV
ncbi:hypothetical protein BDZ91DRAFT_725779 [Kalaharituber pfeilii]|nr:hypothetical protein BDZ91DRAFT_725779 [Kalaharituber pfeilii]